MERVVFIVEATGEQIPCLLNPESLLLQRSSGMETHTLKGGLLATDSLSDDPVIFTGGGTTLLTLNLLFDVHLPEVADHINDVRQLTGPLWQLSENHSSDSERLAPALLRFIWGKAFNVPGVIKEVAEKLEYFTLDGIPQRSFIRLRIQRVADTIDDLQGGALPPPPLPDDFNEAPPALGDDTMSHTLLTTTLTATEEGEGERLDQLAYQYYGQSQLWRLIAWVNELDDPLAPSADSVLNIPSVEDVQP